MSNLNKLTGKVSLGKAFPFAVQQVLAMFVANLVPIVLVCSAAGMSGDQILTFSQNAMIIAGIATFIQSTPFGVIGSGLPLVMGASFTFVVSLSAIAAKHGYGAVMGSVIAGGIFEGLLGLSARYWKKMIAPIVSATVVTGIGLSLLSTATRSFGGGYVEDFGAIHNLVAGSVTIIATIIWQITVKGNKKQLSILVGLGAGYVTALLFGSVSFAGFANIRWFSLPRILPVRPEFRIDAILSIALLYIVSATETIGDASAVTSGVFRREITMEETRGALTVDGFGSALGGLFGVIPVTTYSENIGLTIMTRVVNRKVMRVAALILILGGLFPPVSYLINTVPESVIGGVLIVVMGQIVVSGCHMISDAGFTVRNKLIASLSLAIGIGFTTSTEAGIWVSFPPIVQSIFAQNVVAVIFVMSFLLNLVLPADMEDHNAR